MNCSTSETPSAAAGLARRLGAALAASFALHAALVLALDSQLGATRSAAPGPGAALRVTLREAEDIPTREPVAARAGTLPAPVYYRMSELDVRPWIMTRVEPQYPEAAARRSVTGRVRIQLYIDEAGRVERVRTVRAVPPGFFEQSAERAFLAARFTPGMKNGRPVKVRMTLEVSFE